MKKLFIGCYNKSVILTHLSVACSIFGMANLLWPRIGVYSMDYLRISIILLMLAGICDMFDGTVARRCKRTDQEKEFGIQLDSLADTISFVAYPIVILLYITEACFPAILISIFYAVAGVTRLGWFNIMTDTNKGFYQGLPVTFSALIIPVVYTALKLMNITNVLFIFLALYFAIAAAFILNFKLKKPGMKILICIAVLAIAMIAALLFLV